MQNILITGASSGIGAALAKAYATTDARLFLTGRNEQRLSEIAKQCALLGAAVEQKMIDVVNHEELRAWVSAIDNIHPIDLVIANAGIGGNIGLNCLENFSVVLEVINTNTLGAIATIEPLLHTMKARNKGNIVFISSLASFYGLPQSPIYSASKAALNVYAEGIRIKLAKTNIKVTVVYPGFVESAMSDQVKEPKPFLISAEKAAYIILKGIKNNKKKILFPRRLYYLMSLIKFIPEKVLLFLFERAAKNP